MYILGKEMIALEGTITFAVGGMVGSFGRVGSTMETAFSKNWWLKKILGPEFSLPFKIILDLFRNNLLWEDESL